MPTLTSTYLLPAILLNPAFILHLINTFISHMVPPPPSISHTPHPFMESIGPVRSAAPYLDMHSDEQLCWSYTAVMVVVQILAFGRVSETRVRRKRVKADKIERERLRKEKMESFKVEGKTVGMKGNGHTNGSLDGSCDATAEKALNGNTNGGLKVDKMDKRKLETDSEESLTETSEEEMIV